MTVADLTIGEFLDGVASQALTPSGGAVAAVGGAGGAALCEMTCLHTLARIESTSADGVDLQSLRGDLTDLRNRLLTLADEDVAAVEDLQDTIENADGIDADPVQQAATRATEIPLRTAQACLAVVEHAVDVTEAGTPRATPDAGTGAVLAHASLSAGIWTVRSNLGMIENEEFVADTEKRVDALETAGRTALADVEANVRETW